MTEPNSYGPDKLLVGFWALVGSPPAFIWGWLFSQSPSTGTALPFFLALLFPLTPVLFASRFRVTFAPTEFIYRRWGPTIRVSYSEIERIEVTNVTPITQQPIGAFLVTRCKERLPFWPKLFPREAVRRFFGLARQ
jgi:hypothetical protein